MTAAHVLEADWTWIGGRFTAGIQIEVGADGRIAQVGPLDREADHRLTGQALLPGFVNAHSHAFQRGLRGRGETYPAGAGNFWTWREAMYGLVDELDEVRTYELCLGAFNEMRDAGITAVGEFHYLHHLDPQAQDFALDDVVLGAARASGIRLVLLEAYYRSGGIGRPLVGGQRRFAVGDPTSYWRQMDRLAKTIEGPLQSLGAVAHSIRAADPAEIGELHAEAKRRGLVFHMHLEEQQQEIEACREAYGRGPVELLLEGLEPGREFTAIHCTHTDAELLAAWTQRGAGVCLCPLTEASLADGVPSLASVPESATLSLGSDSNARISMLEEMRWLEYAQRLTRQQRGVLADSAGDGASRLLASATEHGATALGLEAGRIAPGLWADLTAIDLEAPELAGWTAATLAPALVFGCGNRAIAGTAVAGAWRWADDR